MAEIINLRRARKDRARTEREKTAEENRVRFGRTRTEKALAAEEAALAARRLEGHRLPEPPDSPEDDPDRR